jgi:hypothetical protein
VHARAARPARARPARARPARARPARARPALAWPDHLLARPQDTSIEEEGTQLQLELEPEPRAAGAPQTARSARRARSAERPRELGEPAPPEAPPEKRLRADARQLYGPRLLPEMPEPMRAAPLRISTSRRLKRSDVVGGESIDACGAQKSRLRRPHEKRPAAPILHVLLMSCCAPASHHARRSGRGRGVGGRGSKCDKKNFMCSIDRSQ